MATSTDGVQGIWLVMDGRAKTDVDRAIVLEAFTGRSRNQIPRKAARQEWRGQGAVLCFAPENADGTCGPAEYVEDV
jgi:hypothetical protein